MDDGESSLTLQRPRRSSFLGARRQLCALALLGLCIHPRQAGAQASPAPSSGSAPATQSAPTGSASDTISPDSLAARLARAEAAIALLRQQLATESQSTVHTRSRLQLELTGRILTNSFLTLGRANTVDVPLSALPPAPSDSDKNAFGVTARQSRLGGVISVTDVLGGLFTGDMEIDFFGGVQNGPGDRRLFPEPRIRTTRARMRWGGTEVMVGMDDPLISQLNPISVAASGVPDFSGSGNLWNWLGQIRVSRDLATTTVGSTPLRWNLAGGIIAPYAGTQYPGEPDVTDAGERSARPAFEARFGTQWGDSALVGATDASMGNGGGEIGVGVHRGWVSDGEGGLITSYALAMDARVSFTERVELRGEAYMGQVLRGLGGGGIGQAFGKPATPADLGPPIRDKAGWAQLNVQLHSSLIGGAGCGIDVVNDEDRPTRRRNSVCAAHLLWRPAEPIVIGFEFRGMSTLFDTGVTGHAQHLNLGLGFEL